MKSINCQNTLCFLEVNIDFINITLELTDKINQRLFIGQLLTSNKIGREYLGVKTLVEVSGEKTLLDTYVP